MADEKITITRETNPKIRKEECIKEMMAFMDLVGPHAVPKNQMAKKYFFDWHTIDKWLNSLIGAAPKEQIDIIGSKAEQTIDKAIKECVMIIITPGLRASDKTNALSTLTQLLRVQVELLEAYGRKEKVPEKHEVRQISAAKLVIEGGENVVRRILEGTYSEIE